MKRWKFLPFVLVLTLLLPLLGGCGSAASTTAVTTTAAATTGAASTTAAATTAAATQAATTKAATTAATTAAPAATTKPAAKPGTELSDFINGYITAKTAVWDKVNTDLANGPAAMALLGFAFADLAIVIIPLFDAVDAAGGVMMLTGIKNAYRKQNGDQITMGYDYTYDADQGNYQKGDHVVAKGEFNISKQSLKLETTDYKGTAFNNRMVIEVTKNKDNGYSSQIISFDADGKEVSGIFTAFEGENLYTAMAGKAGNKDFTYNTIFGVAGLTVDQMAAGFKTSVKVSYVNGKANMEEVK